jgi:MOSC domain-containing protein YiiM
MKTIQNSNILSLFISTTDGATKKSSIVVDKLGIKGDKFYALSPNRAVLITSTKAYQLMRQHNITADFGVLGENILVDFDINQLSPNDILTIGEVSLQITQHCTICDHLAHIDKTVPTLLRHDRGIFAKVIKGGVICCVHKKL